MLTEVSEHDNFIDGFRGTDNEHEEWAAASHFSVMVTTLLPDQLPWKQWW